MLPFEDDNGIWDLFKGRDGSATGEDEFSRVQEKILIGDTSVRCQAGSVTSLFVLESKRYYVCRLKVLRRRAPMPWAAHLGSFATESA